MKIRLDATLVEVEAMVEFNNNYLHVDSGLDAQYKYLSFLFLPGVPKISIQKTRPESAVELKTARFSLIFFLSTQMP